MDKMKRKQPTMMNQFMLILFASLSHAYEIDPIPIEINVVDIMVANDKVR